MRRCKSAARGPATRAPSRPDAACGQYFVGAWYIAFRRSEAKKVVKYPLPLSSLSKRSGERCADWESAIQGTKAVVEGTAHSAQGQALGITSNIHLRPLRVLPAGDEGLIVEHC